MKSFKELGFESEEELILYQDICGGIEPIINPQLESDSHLEGYSKQMYIDYMKHNYLIDLLSRVKDMTLLDRLIELTIHYCNLYSLYLVKENKVVKNINDAEELYEVENEFKYSVEFNQLVLKEGVILGAINYLHGRAAKSLGKDYIKYSPIFRDSMAAAYNILINGMGNTKQ